MRFLRVLSTSVAASAAAAVMMALVAILTSRFLGPEGRGIYSVVFTTAGLIAFVVNAGLYPANIYYLGKNNQSLACILGNSAIACVAQMVVAGVLIMAIYPSLNISPPFDPFALQCAFWIVAFTTLGENLVASLMLGLHRYSFAFACTVLQGLAVLLAASTLAIGVDQVWTLVFLRVAFSVAMVVAMFSLAWLKLGRPIAKISLPLLRDQLSFGAQNYLQNLITLIGYKIYVPVLAAAAGAHDAGLFSVAVLFVEVIRFMPDAIGTPLYPRLVGTAEQADARDLTAMVMRFTFAGTVLVGLVLAVLLRPVVDVLFGAAFTSMVSATRWMILGAVVGTGYQVLSRYFTSLHQQKMNIVATLSGLVVGLGAAVLLIPTYAFDGAAWSYCLGTATSGIVSSIIFVRRNHLPLRQFLFLNGPDVRLCVESFEQLTGKHFPRLHFGRRSA